MTSDAANLRHFRRVPFASRVRLVGRQGSIETALLDISLKGALVGSPPGWEIENGMPLELELLLGAGSQTPIRMQAEVVHSGHGRVGLCCSHIDLDSITHLRRLVELNLGDSAMLDRELAAMG